MTMCVLKGTNRGVRSLLNESLNITREMLRDAQLAYPRNPVRDKNRLLTTLCLLLHVFYSTRIVMIMYHECEHKCLFFLRVANTDTCYLCSQVLQSLKSKMLDLSCALQRYMYCHISVSSNVTSL